MARDLVALANSALNPKTRLPIGFVQRNDSRMRKTTCRQATIATAISAIVFVI